MTMQTLWQGPETVVPAALRGYRSFRVGTRDEMACLLSTGVDNAWATPELDAACLLPSAVGDPDPDCPCDFCAEVKHPAPQSDCTCGIYGWYRPDDTRLVKSNLLAVVEVSGRVVLGTHGFRAEKARIVALSFEFSHRDSPFTVSFYDESPRSALHEIARWCKDNGVRTFATNAELIEAYPPEDVSALVQHDCAEGCEGYPKPRRSSSHGLSLSSSITLNTASTAAFVKAMESASAYLPATTPKSAPPRWKRWSSLALCALGLALTVAGIVGALIRTIAHGPSWLQAALFVIDCIGAFYWARLGRKAWRWGR